MASVINSGYAEHVDDLVVAFHHENGNAPEYVVVGSSDLRNICRAPSAEHMWFVPCHMAADGIERYMGLELIIAQNHKHILKVF